jgi:hypothetical protein
MIKLGESPEFTLTKYLSLSKMPYFLKIEIKIIRYFQDKVSLLCFIGSLKIK